MGEEVKAEVKVEGKVEVTLFRMTQAMEMMASRVVTLGVVSTHYCRSQ